MRHLQFHVYKVHTGQIGNQLKDLMKYLLLKHLFPWQPCYVIVYF